MSRPVPPRRDHSSGQALVEFSLICFLMVFTLLSVFELCRMFLVYTSLANASRVAVRYASVHGSTNSGSGADGPSGPGNTSQVENVVRSYLQGSLVDMAKLNITVQYPAGGGPGARVRVLVTYPYDPFMVLPLNVPIGSSTEGIIVF